MDVVRMSSAILLCACSGCLVFEETGDLPRVICGKRTAVDHSAQEISDVRPDLRAGGEGYELRLVADGAFIRHTEETVDYYVGGKSKELAIGFFPGAYAMPGMSKSFVWAYPFVSTALNAFCLAIPTVCSLFIEPFRGYHEYDAVTTSGLFGCCKYYGPRISKVETEKRTRDERCGEMVLVGYSIRVDGAEMHPDAHGVVKLPKRPSKSRIILAITAPPEFRRDSKENASELVGVVLEALCP